MVFAEFLTTMGIRNAPKVWFDAPIILRDGSPAYFGH
jgi:hypothetical protein